MTVLTLTLLFFLSFNIIHHFTIIEHLEAIKYNQHEVLNLLDYILNDDGYYDEADVQLKD